MRVAANLVSVRQLAACFSTRSSAGRSQAADLLGRALSESSATTAQAKAWMTGRGRGMTVWGALPISSAPLSGPARHGRTRAAKGALREREPAHLQVPSGPALTPLAPASRPSRERAGHASKEIA